MDLQLFVASFVVIGLAVGAMAVGVVLGRRPIAGSCGGIAGRCAACTRPCVRTGRD